MSDNSTTPLWSAIQDFSGEIGTWANGFVSHIWAAMQTEVFAGIVIGMLSSWGAVYWAERWAHKRERRGDVFYAEQIRKERLRGVVAELVRNYQIYVRLLRTPVEKRSEADLNLAHANFITSIKLLGLEKGFEKQATYLREISDLAANIAAGNVSEENFKQRMNHIYARFDGILKALSGKI